MKIILLKDVPKIGKKYETKEIAQGYAQNMLIPKGLAVIATPKESARIEAIKSREQGEVKIRQDLLAKNLASIDGQTVTITQKANDKGHLFAGLHADLLHKLVTEQLKVTLPKESLDLKLSIKEIGEHKITFRAGNKQATVTVNIAVGK